MYSKIHQLTPSLYESGEDVFGLVQESSRMPTDFSSNVLKKSPGTPSQRNTGNLFPDRDIHRVQIFPGLSLGHAD